MYILRAATHADFEFVFRLHERNMRPYVEALRGWNEYGERLALRRVYRPDTYDIVVVHDVEAGVLSVSRQPTCIEIRHIELLPGFQKQGLGTEIIRDLL